MILTVKQGLCLDWNDQGGRAGKEWGQVGSRRDLLLGLLGHFDWNGGPLEVLMWLDFLKDTSGCWEQNRDVGGGWSGKGAETLEARRPARWLAQQSQSKGDDDLYLGPVLFHVNNALAIPAHSSTVCGTGTSLFSHFVCQRRVLSPVTAQVKIFTTLPQLFYN